MNRQPQPIGAGHFSATVREYGAKALTLGGLSWRQLAAQLWRRGIDNDIAGRAAQLSYYFLLALFPLLIFISSLIAHFFTTERALYFRTVALLAGVMPQPAFELLHKALDQIREQTSTGQLTFGLLLTLWAASSGMQAIIDGLNLAFGVHQDRRWWRSKLLAIALTITLAVLVALVVLLVVASNAAGAGVAYYFPVLEKLGRLSGIVQWTIGILFLLLALSLIYLFAPNLRRPPWKATLPGAVLSLVCWLAASFAYRFYLSEFGNISETYGQLGAVIVLMIWLYVSGAAILIGGELNSVIWHALVRSRG
jgi:membrane protein